MRMNKIMKISDFGFRIFGIELFLDHNPLTFNYIYFLEF